MIIFSKRHFFEGIGSIYCAQLHNSPINDINSAIELIAKKHDISINDAEEVVAEEISKLGLFAKDPKYIRKWWNKYDVINSSEGTFKLYGVEHPKSLSDLIKIYNWLDSTIPELSLKNIDAEKCYSASILIQGMRISLLKGKIKYTHLSFVKLKSKLENEIKDILKNTDTFRIALIRKVKLTQNVKEHTILKEFKDYI